MVLLALLSAVIIPGCSDWADRPPKDWVIPYGETTFAQEELHPEDTFLCAGLDEREAVEMPEPGHFFNSTLGIQVETDGDGRVTVSCGPPSRM